VRLLFEEFDAETRELLALRFAAGLTAREIAAVVGKSEAATRKTLTRTIQLLKERYDDETRCALSRSARPR
jgi:RNA polymerase sigma-70 factor (ECF subfamily)